MKNIQNLTIDINKKPFQVITANVGEVASRFIRITILENNMPADLTGVTAYLYAKKADGTKVFNSVTVEDAKKGIVLAELTSQVLAIAGLVKLNLLLTKNGAKLASKQIIVAVDESAIDEEAIQSTNEFNALTDALKKVNNIDNKLDKNAILSMANMGQDIKEAMTGGSVAVVGKNSILTDNIVNKQVTPQKTSFIDVKKNINLINPNNIIENYYLGGDQAKIYEGAFYSEVIEVNKGDVVRCAYSATFTSFPGTVFLNDGTYINIKNIPDFTISDSMNKYNNNTFRYWTVTMPENAVSIVVNGLLSWLHTSFIFTINNELPDKFIQYEEVNRLTENIKLPIFYEEKIENLEKDLEKDLVVTPQKTNFITIDKSVNLFNKDEAVLGKYQQNGTNQVEDSNYYLVKIDIKENDIIRVTYNPRLASNPCHVFNSDGIRIANINQLSDYTVTDSKFWSATMPSDSSYIVINGQISCIDENMIIVNNEYPDSYIEYREIKMMDKDINIPLSLENKERLDILENTLGINSVLNGKKWIACGDSITYGANADLDDEGKRKTYAYYVAKNNNMSLEVDAISGSTMMNVTGKNPFSVDRYKNIPSDADYITLAFVTNDSASSTDLIGNIDDTTNDTFYGAWNTVLSYIIANHPTAKIGIIGFWRGNQRYQYTDALRNIAKKFRIPFLDFMFDYKIPLVGGTDFRSYNPSATEPYVDYNTLVSRQNTFLADTVHPNDKGYVYMSSIVENWLRSL